ncbi:MAG: hypothetical protein AAB557_01005 [Patescibacteria group bacterium]
MKLSKKQIISFHQKIFLWWKTHRRDLPWRRTRDPYRIMVSEVMLQQTQVLRVLPKYAEFIERFPTVCDLAQATPADVLRVWKGMGYNRRALYLHRTAKIICDQYNGHFPMNCELLNKLPGLGTYTARALLVFAYEKEVPLVDTNIRQIITHFFFPKQAQARLPARQGRALEKEIEDIARQLIPPGKSWEWHQALMDYGALRLVRARSGSLTKVSRRTSIPFRDSNRFYRGRIIDRLREGEAKESNLIKEFKKKYAKPASFLQSILQGLEADGLITRSKAGIITLPE